MAAYLDTIPLPPHEWTAISSGAVSAMRFVNVGNASLFFMVTAANSQPANTDGAIPYHPGDGERADVLLQTLFPNAGSSGYAWAMCHVDGEVSVSHA